MCFMFTFMFRICMYVLILPNKYQSINQSAIGVHEVSRAERALGRDGSKLLVVIRRTVFYDNKIHMRTRRFIATVSVFINGGRTNYS